MKKTSKLLILFAVLALLISVVCLPASAAGSNYYLKVESGKSGYEQEVILTEDESIVSVQGTITVSNPTFLSGIMVEQLFAGTDMAVGDQIFQSQPAEFVIYNDDFTSDVDEIGLYFNLAVNPNTFVGETCTITIEYDLYDSTYEKVNLAPLVIKMDLEVLHSEIKVNLEALKAAIANAEALVERDYSLATWEKLEVALANAKVALGYNLQGRIDAATEALVAATNALEKLDYAALEAAIKAAEALSFNGSLMQSPDVLAFANALDEAKRVNIRAVDQNEIDAAADALNAAIEQLNDAVFTTGPQQTVTVPVPGETVTVIVPGETVTVTVPGETVPVEPDDFCNKGMHKVWLILFIVFAVIAVILATLLIIKEVKKGKAQKDETPEATDYDISDDDADEATEEVAEETEEAAEETEEAADDTDAE